MIPAPAPERLLSIVQRPAKAEPVQVIEQPVVAPTAAYDGADSSYGLAALEAECATIKGAACGAQEAALNEASIKIGSLVAGGALTYHTALSRLIAAGVTMVSYDRANPWTNAQIATKVERGLADGAKRPRNVADRAWGVPLDAQVTASVHASVANLPWPSTNSPINAAPPLGALPAWKTGISARALMTKQFNPICYVVRGLLAEGLTVFAGAPKTGKSWMALGVALAVASDEAALGSLPVEAGDVLYLALEDNERRLKKRLQKMGVSQPPERLTLVTQWPDLDNGCIAEIEAWAEAVEAPKLVIVDVLTKVRPRSGSRDNQYEADYRVLTGLHAIASERAIAVLVLHHTRKMEAEDPFDLVSGTRGLTGAADTVMVLKRNPRSPHSGLYGRGRDIEEFEKAIAFDTETGRWSIVGDATAIAKTDERQQILSVLVEAETSLTPTSIAARLGKERSNVQHLLGRLLDEGKVTKDGRGYYTPVTLVTPFTLGGSL